ncbi:MAG: hypothetical protein J6Y58_11750 [Clostridiales bacterium]|nr:hypothetical protein [Clostridiales bacterium]
MLGDELKKALEPIQTSDELLEKTRRAIEQARIQQAQESLDKAVRKDARRTLFLKAMVPVACVLLIFGGLAVVLLPKLGGARKDERSKDRPVKEHNDAINTVTAEIDSILGKDSKNQSYRSTDAWSFEEDSSDEVESLQTTYAYETENIAEETTEGKTEREGRQKDPEEMSKYFSDSLLTYAEDHTIAVSADRSGIIIDWDNQQAVAPRFKNGNNYLGTKNSDETDRITGLFYDKETKTLYITISHFDDLKYTASKKYLYAVPFENGTISENGPELVCVVDN